MNEQRAFAWGETATTGPVRVAVAVTPSQRRDEVLDALAVRRAEVVRLAVAAARTIAATCGGVTGADVQRHMAERHPSLVAGLDPRWIGAVLLPSNGFERTGELARTGSRARPQPVWRVAR